MDINKKLKINQILLNEMKFIFYIFLNNNFILKTIFFFLIHNQKNIENKIEIER